jgi:hypothetical protein
MGTTQRTGSKLNPETIQKINSAVNTAIEKSLKGKTLANLNEAKALKQVKDDINKQAALQLKGVEAPIKDLVNKTIEKTIADSWNAAKSKLKPK